MRHLSKSTNLYRADVKADVKREDIRWHVDLRTSWGQWILDNFAYVAREEYIVDAVGALSFIDQFSSSNQISSINPTQSLLLQAKT